jgi:hypothetical protein
MEGITVGRRHGSRPRESRLHRHEIRRPHHRGNCSRRLHGIHRHHRKEQSEIRRPKTDPSDKLTLNGLRCWRRHKKRSRGKRRDTHYRRHKRCRS